MPPSHLLKIHLNIILPTPGFSKWLFPSGFPTKTLHTLLLYLIRAVLVTQFKIDLLQ